MRTKSFLYLIIVVLLCSLFSCNGKFLNIKPNLPQLSIEIEFPGGASIVICKTELNGKDIFQGLLLYKSDTVVIDIPASLVYSLIKLKQKDVLLYNSYLVDFKYKKKEIRGVITTPAYIANIVYTGAYKNKIKEDFPFNPCTDCSDIYKKCSEKHLPGLCFLEKLAAFGI